MTTTPEAIEAAAEQGVLAQVGLGLLVQGVQRFEAFLALLEPGDRLLGAPAAADLVAALKCAQRLAEIEWKADPKGVGDGS